MSGGAAKPDPGRATWATTVNRQAPTRPQTVQHREHRRLVTSVVTVLVHDEDVGDSGAGHPRGPTGGASATNPTPVSVSRNGRWTSRNGAATAARATAPDTEPGCRYRPLADVPTTRAPDASASPAGAVRPVRRYRAATPSWTRSKRMAGTGAVRLDDDDGVPGGREPRLEVGPCVAPMVADQLVGGPVAMRVRGNAEEQRTARTDP